MDVSLVVPLLWLLLSVALEAPVREEEEDEEEGWLYSFMTPALLLPFSACLPEGI